MSSGGPSNPPPSRIALVGLGSNSFTNPSVEAALRKRFPAQEIDWFDLAPLVMARPLMRLRSLTQAALEFPSRIGLDPRRLKRQRLWTTYMFEQRSRAAAEVVKKDRYLFSMQIQSTYDASIPGLPHFIYTDNTLLASLQYNGTTKSDLPVTDSWLELERRSYNNAAACFVMSKNVGKSLVEDYGCHQENVICAYGGRNTPAAPNAADVVKHKNVLFVGVDWERKGGPDLIEAFRLVRARIPDATLTVIGCSPAVTEPGCRIVGRVPPNEVGHYYANASIFCMPTRHEPFGIAFVEAMAHKLPVVATNVGAIPDFVTTGQNGFCVSPGDVHGLASSLITLLENPTLRQEMGERSGAVSEKYTWQNVTAIMRRHIECKIGVVD